MTTENNAKKKKGLLKKILITVGAVLAAVLLFLVFYCCLSYFRGKNNTKTFSEYAALYPDLSFDLLSDGTVILAAGDPSSDLHTGIIMNQGAFIPEESYIPVMAGLAEKGYTCFIPHHPLNIAVLGNEITEKIRKENPQIEKWYIAGHSMGGSTASQDILDHPGTFSGLIFMGSFAGKDITASGVPVLLLFAENDGVCVYESHKKYRVNCPADTEEYVIAGGNHAGFGDYKKQMFDGEASITTEEQHRKADEIILDWISRH